jgi:tetratricopeptide (TPR) repeat protein
VAYLDLANQKAVRANAMQDAKTYFDQAMGLLDVLPDTEISRERRIGLLGNQVLVFEQLLQFPKYYDLLIKYEPLADKITDPRRLADFYANLGYGEMYFCQFDRAIQASSRAVDICRAAGRDEDAAVGWSQLQWEYLWKGEFDRVDTLLGQVLLRLHPNYSLFWYVRALLAASWAFSLRGWWDKAVQLGQQALSLAQEYSDNSQISFAYFSLSFAYSYKGDQNRAVECSLLAANHARNPADNLWSGACLGIAASRAGKANQGIESLLASFETTRAVRFRFFEMFLGNCLAEAYFMTNECDKAEQLCKATIEIAEHCEARPFVGFSRRLLGEIALKTNPGDAPAHFEKAIAINKEIKAENELALAYSGMGRYHKLQGNVEQAREYLTKALEIFERLGTLLEPEKVREELAEL